MATTGRRQPFVGNGLSWQPVGLASLRAPIQPKRHVGMVIVDLTILGMAIVLIAIQQRDRCPRKPDRAPGAARSRGPWAPAGLRLDHGASPELQPSSWSASRQALRATAAPKPRSTGPLPGLILPSRQSTVTRSR